MTRIERILLGSIMVTFGIVSAKIQVLMHSVNHKYPSVDWMALVIALVGIMLILLALGKGDE